MDSETLEAEGKFLSLLEKYEQRIFEISQLVTKETHDVSCTGCGERTAAPIYLHAMLCKKCRPTITLEEDSLHSLLQTERLQLYNDLSDVDNEFSSKDRIQLRDKVLDALEKINTFVEASAEASSIVASRLGESFDLNDFDSLGKKLLQLKSIASLSEVYGLDADVVEEILKTKIDVLFGKKPGKTPALPIPR